MSQSFFLRSINSDLSVGGAGFNRQLLDTTAAPASHEVSLAASETLDHYAWTEPGVPDTGGGPGDYTVSIHITSGATQINVSSRFARVNSSGVVQAESDFSTPDAGNAGVKVHEFPATDLGTWQAGDRLRVQYRFVNSDSMMARSLTIEKNTVETEVITPWAEAGQPVVITLSPASVTASAVPANPQTAFSFADAIIPNRGPSRVGPFQSVAGDFYTIVLRKSDKKDLGAMKSSDPSVSWGNVGSNMSYGQEIRCVWVLQEADLLHVILQISSVGNNTFYSLFNMETDQWDISQEQVPNLEGSSAPNFGCSIARSPAGETLVAFMAGREDFLGIMALNARSGGSWGAAGKMFLGPDSHGQLHRGVSTNQMIFRDPGLGGWSTARQASEPIVLIDGNDSEDPHSGAGVRYLDGSTIRIAFPYARGGDGKVGVGRGVPSSTGAGTWSNSGDVSNLPVKILSLTPIACIAVHGTDLHLLYADATNANLHHLTSDDAGITWGSETEIEVGTANAVSAHLLDRGELVIGYLWDNNGTLTYGEVSLAEGPVVVNVSSVTVTAQAQALEPQAPVVVAISPIAVTAQAQPLDTQIPTVVEITPVSATTQPQALSAQQAPVAITLSPATVTSQAQTLEPQTVVVVTVTPATVTSQAQALDPQASEAPVVASIAPVTVTSQPQALSAQQAPKAITVSPATVTTDPQALTPQSATAIQVSPVTVTTQAQPVDPQTARIITITPAQVTAQPQPLTSVQQPKTITVTPSEVVTQAQPLQPELAPTAITVSPATVTTQAQALDPIAGVSVTLAPITVSATPQVLQVTGSSVLAIIAPITVSAQPQPLALQLGAHETIITPAAVTTEAQPLDPVRAPVTVNIEPVTVTTTAESLTPTQQPVAVQIAPAQVATQAQPLAIGDAPVTINIAPITVTATPQAQTVLVGTFIVISPATVATSAQSLTAQLQPVVVELVPAQVTTEAQPQVLLAVVVVIVSPITVTTLVQTLSATGGTRPRGLGKTFTDVPLGTNVVDSPSGLSNADH